MKRIGIVGLGDIAAKAYLPVVSANPGVAIAGIMSRSRETVERVGEAYRIAGRYTDLKELLRQEPELVFVHSPTETHTAIVLECLRAGCHVYVDKPLSYTIAESEGMAEEAARRGLLLAVGFNRRFAPHYMAAKEWLEEVGGFTLCTAQKHRTRTQRLSAKETLYDDLIHMLDLLLWLGGSSCEVRDFAAETGSAGELLHGSGTLGFARGVGFFSMQRGAGLDLERVELHGGGRSAEVTNLEQAVMADRQTGERTQRFGSWTTIQERRGFSGIVRHVLETLERPDTCTVRAELVLPVHQLVERLLL